MLIKVIDPVTKQITWQESNDAVVVHTVDQSGNYLGLLAPGAGTVVDYAPPPGTGWVYDFQKRNYNKVINLAIAIKLAQREIDSEAAEIRAKYITITPGQESVYIYKKIQADKYIDAYALNVNAPVPKYVQAEADASNVTPIQAANTIVSEADSWETISANIEKIRRQGKIFVGNSSTKNQVANRLDTVLQALRAI